MLVLTRKRGETIKIGDDILVKVVQTGRGSVKIGIQAPSHLRVLRGELTPFIREIELDLDASDSGIPAEVEQFLNEFGDLFSDELDEVEEGEGPKHRQVAALN